MALIEVWTAEDLDNIRNNLEGHYIQMADIDLGGIWAEGEGWDPIAGPLSFHPRFIGSYDGNGFKIKNLKINRPSESGAGLFRRGYDCLFKNISLTNVDIVGQGICGGLIGTATKAEIENVTVSGTVAGSQVGLKVGLLVGWLSSDSGDFDSTIKKCSTMGSLSGQGFCGGLCGAVEKTSVEKSYSFANISATTTNAGGLIGVADSSIINNCYARGNVTAEEDMAGLIGNIQNWFANQTEVINCYSTGEVIELSEWYSGAGLINKVSGEFLISNSFYDVETSKQNDNIGRGEPKTTEEMQNIETYNDWDFEEIWGIHPELNDGYPYLLWEDLQLPEPLLSLRNIATYILQRGWLQKEDPINTISGWTVIGKSEILERPINVSLSNSNTYNGLVEIANSINLNLRFNYNSKTVEFYSRDDDDLDKNYTLSESFNLENYTKNYEGSNLYSLFYVEGGQDELGRFITLFDEVEYRDNFLLNLDYFKDTGILSIDDYNQIMVNFEDGGELQKINTRLSELIKDKFNQIDSINTLWNIIRNSSEIMYGDTTNTEIYMREYERFFRAFELFEWDPAKIVEKRVLTKSFAAWWSSLDLAFDVQPETWTDLVYNGTSYNTSNFIYTLSFETGPGLREYYFQTPGGGRIVYYASESGFTEELLTDVQGTVRYFKNVITDNNEKQFPLVRALHRLDGENSLDEKAEEIQGQIDFLKEGWVWDYRVKRCLDTVDLENPQPEDIVEAGDYDAGLCNFLVTENLMPSTWAAVEERLASINQKFDDRIYQKQLGEGSFSHLAGSEVELNIDETTLGRWTHIQKYFNKTRVNFIPINTPIMENYRKEWQKKLNFWYELKEDRQHIFLEGYFEDDVESNAEDLKTKAEIVYQNHKTPNEDFGISYIDPSEILGLEINALRVGDFVKFKDSSLNEESRLKVASISRVLKQNSNITVNIYRYNMVNQLLEQMIARINQRGV